MIVTAWAFIGVVALVITSAAILTPDDGWAIVLGVAGFLSWAVVAYGAFDVTSTSNGVIIEHTMPVVAFFAVIMSLIPGFIALTGPTEIINRARNPQTEDL